MPPISHRLAKLRLSNTSSEKKQYWENPEASIGDFCRTMGKSQCWHAQGPARELFVLLAAEIKTYLDRNCEPPSRELHWSLYMIGQTESTARPVLMFICEDSNSRKTVRKTIKESGILLRYPGVDTADCSHPPDFGQLVQLALRRKMDDLEDLSREMWSLDIEDSYSTDFDYLPGGGSSGGLYTGTSPYPSNSGQLKQPVINEHTDKMVIKPANSETAVFYRPTDNILGSHVFVKDPYGTDSMSRKATAGVIVKLGDKICFLTAAHGLASRPPPAGPSPPFEFDIDGESNSDDEEFLQTIRQGSNSPLSKHSDLDPEESETSILKSSSSQDSELNTEETVTERDTTDSTATVEATSTRHNSSRQNFDDSTHHQRRHRPSRSRSSSRSRARTRTTTGLGAAALARAVALAQNNSQEDSRSRSRHRPRSQSPGVDTASRTQSRNKHLAASGFAGHVAGGLVERAPSKSSTRSKSRTRRVSDLFDYASAHKRPLESGTVLVSSVEGSDPGLDYALIEVEGSHARMPNKLLFNNGIHQFTLNPIQVSDSRPKDANMVAITGSSGHLSGRLLGTPTFVRVPGQPSQELWTAKFDGKLEQGDCGTCVFDTQTGDMYGHVVAGNPDSGYAYIIPAYQVRDDLLRRFGEDLQLYKPAIHGTHGNVSTLPSRPMFSTNRSLSKESPLLSRPRPSDDMHKPPLRPNHQRFAPTSLEPRSQKASHGAFVKKGSEYFIPGRIFIVRWSEPIRELRTTASSNSEDISVIDGQPMISYWRRMVVIKSDRGENSSTCVGMFTYGGQGLAKPGLDPDKHAQVFDERLDKPQTRPDEPPLKGPPLAVCIESPFEKLDPMYRINFGVTYTVEHSMEIRDVGHVAEESMYDFMNYVAEALKAN